MGKITTKQLKNFCNRATTTNHYFAHKCYKYLAWQSYLLDTDEEHDTKELRDATAYVVHYLYLAEKERMSKKTACSYFAQTAVDIGNQKDMTSFENKVAIILLDMVGKQDKIARYKNLLDEEVYKYALEGKILYDEQ